jgi:hypothetical protein
MTAHGKQTKPHHRIRVEFRTAYTFPLPLPDRPGSDGVRISRRHHQMLSCSPTAINTSGYRRPYDDFRTDNGSPG